MERLADTALTRRTLLRSAAGAAAVSASGALPAWARPIAAAAPRLRRPDSRPFPALPEGTPSMPKIEHIVVLMMENHSFDNFLGMVPHQLRGRRSADGLTLNRGRVQNYNRDQYGQRVFAQHATSPCQLHAEPSQAWDASHTAWDGGLNDGFVRASAPVAMRFWDQRDLPFTYSLVEHFPFGDRYFCSTLAQTYPNRRFFFTGTASGTIATDSATFGIPAANGTIWDRLDAQHVDWAVYYQEVPSLLIVPGSGTSARGSRLRKIDQFYADAGAGKLPQFTFLDPNYDTTSEENPQDIQVGEEFVANIVNALMKAPTWKNTALFITWDEHGGYYDHVPPPRAIKPDSIKPLTKPGDAPGGYDRYGFRVPLMVVSPWARANYVSHLTQDHTSITAFIERKWNLPAMTYRDANAQQMTDYFDFRHAAFLKPPRLAPAPALAPGLAKCRAAGITDTPLPAGTPGSGTVARDLARAAARAGL
jgi:phospholipase C